MEPPKRSGGGCLLRTDHMLGGAESSTLIRQFNLAIQEFAEELGLDEA